jgi:hypothetical protein
MENPLELYQVTVTLSNGKSETFDDVLKIEPTTTGLLVLYRLSGETVVFPLVGNVRKYTFKMKGTVN